MKLYRALKNGIEISRWKSDFADHTHREEWFAKPAVIDENGNVIIPAEEIEVVETDITAELTQKNTNETSRKFLLETDWKVLRHRDQLELGVPTSLTEAEFAQLLADRQAAREAIQE